MVGRLRSYKLANVLHNYVNVFSESPADFGECDTPPFKLTAPPGTPPVRSPHWMNPTVSAQVGAILAKYLAAGVIQHSTSAYRDPIVVMIPNKPGDLRITVSYQQLNRVTLADWPCQDQTTPRTNFSKVLVFRSLISLGHSIRSECTQTPYLSPILQRLRGCLNDFERQ